MQSLLAHLCCSLSSPHLLLAPFPTLVTAFLPGARASLHDPTFLGGHPSRGITSLAGPPGFEPGASGLEGQRYILAKPRAHSFPHLLLPFKAYSINRNPDACPSSTWSTMDPNPMNMNIDSTTQRQPMMNSRGQQFSNFPNNFTMDSAKLSSP